MPSSSGEEGVCPSNPKKERVMTMVAFLLPSVESCGGGHRISSREEEVCLSSLEKVRMMAMVTFLPSSIKNSEGGHGLSHHLLEERGPTLLLLRQIE